MPARVAAVLFLLFLACGAGSAQTASTQSYNEGNHEYAEGRFEAARDLYLQATTTGVRDSRLFYNLGNACFKAGQLGEAILWYERALRLAPRDPDIAHNLRYARAVKVDSDPEPGSLVWRALDRAFSYPTLNELCVATSVFLVLLFGLGSWRILGRRQPGTLWTVLTGASLVLLVGSGLWLGTRMHRSGMPEAVLIATAGSARSGPDQDQTVVFQAHEGTKFQVERQQDGWVLVRLANGLGGWLPSDQVALI
jgi:tetratricopeptide (TPR) repeat protein